MVSTVEKVKVNGEERVCAGDPVNLAEQLKLWGYLGDAFAVALNGTFIPRRNYEFSRLKDGDELEIVAPMQGG